MAQKKGETQEQYMDRLRAVRGEPPMREDPRIMDRTRAAVCYLNTTNDGGDGPLAMNAFLAIFHPEIVVGSSQWLELTQAARENVRRY